MTFRIIYTTNFNNRLPQNLQEHVIRKYIISSSILSINAFIYIYILGRSEKTAIATLY